MKKTVKKTSVTISPHTLRKFPVSRLFLVSKKSIFISAAALSMPLVAHASSQWIVDLHERQADRKTELAVRDSPIEAGNVRKIGPTVYEWRISPLIGMGHWSFEQNGNVAYQNLSIAGGAKASVFFPQASIGFDAESSVSLLPISGTWKQGEARLLTAHLGFRRPIAISTFDGYALTPGAEFHYSNTFVTDRRFGFANLASIGPTVEISKSFRGGLSAVKLKSAVLPVASQGVAFGLSNLEYTVNLGYEQLPSPGHASSLGFAFNMGYDKLTANVAGDLIKSQNFISSFSLLY